MSKGLSGQGEEWGFQFNIMMDLLNALCGECGGVVVMHIDEAGEVANLRVVYSEIGTARAGRRKVVKRPAVAEMYVVIKI